MCPSRLFEEASIAVISASRSARSKRAVSWGAAPRVRSRWRPFYLIERFGKQIRAIRARQSLPNHLIERARESDATEPIALSWRVNAQAEQIQRALDIAYNVLMTQLNLGGAFDDGSEAQKRLASDFAFGYAFGFTDALLQAAGVTDELQAIAYLTATLTRIFAATGPEILKKCISIQGEPEFEEGRLLGAYEVPAWLGNKTAPMSLAQYLIAKKSPGAIVSLT